MNALYKAIGISKQAFHQKMERVHTLQSIGRQFLYLVHKIRQDHPTMGVRDIYYKLKPDKIGRDAFELMCRQEGLCMDKPRAWTRTTDSSGVIRFENLLEGFCVTGINQVWQSDITYYEVNGRFYYITFIQDAYSKVILGYQVSSRLFTGHTTIPALHMAIKYRKGMSLKDLIFHSDGGGQYYEKEFLGITNHHEMKNSMCEYAWENGMAERLNGVIKNNYLRHKKINSFEVLKKEVDRTVLLYNNEKPHIKLGRKTPCEFERNLILLQQQTKPMMTESFEAKHSGLKGH